MIRWLLHNSATVWLVTACVSVLGFVAYASLPREASPDVNIPFVMVTTPYPGVSPEDIEALITTPIENELAGISKLKKLSSTSAEGISIISLEFEPQVDIADALQRVRDRVGIAQSKLPQQAEDTSVREISFSDFPVLLVTLAGSLDEQALKDLAEDLQDKLERIEGVLSVNMSGGRERQVRVQVDPIRLAHYSLSLDDVISAIQSENVNIPGGNLTVGGSNYLLRIPGEFVVPQDVERVAIKRKGGQPVFISDVAVVLDGFADRTTYARMNGEAAVSLALTKRSGANILELSEAAKALVAKESVTWPPGIHYRAMGDQSDIIRDMVSDLENGILTALLLVVLVLILTMGWRSSVYVALAIPLSFLLSMLVLQALGITLNMIVLFSLILALGMLVDNAIVIVENVYRHRQEGASAEDAAARGTSEVAIAVTASTATTVAAFAPLVAWSGMMGEFMGYLPKTVIIVLVSSLVVALTFLPTRTSQRAPLVLQILFPPFLLVEALLRFGKSGSVRMAPSDDAGLRGAYKRLLLASIERRFMSACVVVLSLVGTFVIYGRFNHGT